MPVVAIVAGIAGAVGAASGAAALVGGAFTLANVGAGLAFVGGVSTALGAATGNKKLQKFGMIAGLGGAAVGGLASLSSGTAASPYALASEAGTTGLGLKAGADAASTLGDGLAGSAAGTGLAAEAVSGLGSVADASLSSTAMPPANYGLARPQGTGLLSAANAPPAAKAMQAAAPLSPPALPPASFSIQAGTPMPAPDTPSGLLGTATNGLKGFGSFLGKNPEMTKIGLGALSSYGEAQAAQKQLDARQKELDEARLRINRSITNQRQSF